MRNEHIIARDRAGKIFGRQKAITYGSVEELIRTDDTIITISQCKIPNWSILPICQTKT